MAWSPNRLRGNGPTGSPFFTDLSPPPLRTMLALSGAAHLLLAIAALAVPSLFGTPLRLEPVAVVDLIGGGSSAGKRGSPRGRPPPAKRRRPPARKAGKAEKTPPATKGKAPKKAVAVAAPDEFTASKRRAPDTSSVEERLRQMREARAGSDAVREAVQDRRREAAARAPCAAWESAWPTGSSSPVRAVRGARGGGRRRGAEGSVRLSPETARLFPPARGDRTEQLDPPGHVRDAAKLVVELRIVIEKDGRVSEARIEKGFEERLLRRFRAARHPEGEPPPGSPEQLLGGEDHYEVGFRFHGSEEAG